MWWWIEKGREETPCSSGSHGGLDDVMVVAVDVVAMNATTINTTTTANHDRDHVDSGDDVDVDVDVGDIGWFVSDEGSRRGAYGPTHKG